MDFFLQIDMAEVTRLTRAGRLDEAMTLLQKGQTAKPGPGDYFDSQILDMKPPTGQDGTWPPLNRPLPLDRLADRFAGYGAWSKGKPQTTPEARPTPLPNGAAFEEFDFSDQAGSRSYKLYSPSGYAGQLLPLVVMLHGCTQSPDDFARGTRMNQLAEEQTFFVAYPAQTQSANISKCWNWYSPKDQKRGSGEPSLIAGITRRIIRNFSVDPARVYVAGLSAGGAAAAIMAVAYPDLYSAIGVHSGLACGAAHDIPTAFAAMRRGSNAAGPSRAARGIVPTILFHGDRDTTVNPVNGDQLIAQLKTTADLRVSVSGGKSAGGMRYTRTVHSDSSGEPMLEQWNLHGAGHAWSGGSLAGSFTDPHGPDASREMIRFFLRHAAKP